ATVSSATPDSNPANNTAAATATVTTQADLWLDKTGTVTRRKGVFLVTYTLVVHNDRGCESDADSTPSPNCGTGGPSDAHGVVVVDELPLSKKKFDVQSVSPQCHYARKQHTVTCSAATVPAGASVRFVIKAEVKHFEGLLENDADLTSGTFDPVATNNENDVT